MTAHLTRRILTAGTIATAMIAPYGLTASARADTAAQLSVNSACYAYSRAGTPIVVSGSGFAPSQTVLLTDRTGDIDVKVPASATGTITATIKAPRPFLEAPGAKRDTLTAEQFTENGTYKGTASFGLTETLVGTSRTKAEPGLKAFTERVKWSFSGFPAGRTVYAHYTFGGKLVATQGFGKPQGACGILKVRKRLFPATPHHKGYSLQIDLKKKYSKHTEPALHTKIKLTVF